MIHRLFSLFFLVFFVSLIATAVQTIPYPDKTETRKDRLTVPRLSPATGAGASPSPIRPIILPAWGDSTISLIAPTSGVSVTMNFAGQTPGTYTCGQVSPNVLYFQSGLSTYGSLNQNASCEIVVATYTSSRITGNFSGVLLSGSRRVTIEGEFTVPRPQ